MASFESKDTAVAASAEQVYQRFSNLEGLRTLLDGVPAESIPADKRELLDSMVITSDSISFPAGPVGSITLKLKDLQPPVMVSLEGVDTPVPLKLTLNIRPEGETGCNIKVVADVEVPMMFRPMISGPMTKAVDQFAQVIAAVPFGA